MESNNNKGTNDSSGVIKDDGSSAPLRNKIINTAVEFLVSTSVQNAPMNMKISFLKKKGLSDSEIDVACKLAEERLSSKISKEVVEFHGLPPVYHPPPTRWSNFRDLANSVVLFTGFIYGAYWVYKKFIVPYLFGKRYKKSIENQLEDIERTLSACIGDINSNLIKLKENIDDSDFRTGRINKQIEELKSEVTSLKKLLLNRKQFPTTNISIPAWQIPGSDGGDDQSVCASHTSSQGGAEEEGNGTNGSDSSLEMIKE